MKSCCSNSNHSKKICYISLGHLSVLWSTLLVRNKCTIFTEEYIHYLAEENSQNGLSVKPENDRLERKQLQGTEEAFFTFSGLRVNTRAERGSSSDKSHLSGNKQLNSALFLWTFPSHWSPQVPAICSVNTVTNAGHMFSQHSTPKTSFMACLLSTFWLFVCWKLVWFTF